MTIGEFIKKHAILFENCDKSPVYFKDLPGKVLLELQNEVDIFKNAKISIMEFPQEDGKQAMTYKLHDNIEFAGDCLLYSITFSPEIYNKGDFFTKFPVITPIIHTDDFIPLQYLILPVYPEAMVDMNVNGTLSQFKKLYHSIVDDFFTK